MFLAMRTSSQVRLNRKGEHRLVLFRLGLVWGIVFPSPELSCLSEVSTKSSNHLIIEEIPASTVDYVAYLISVEEP